MIGVPTAPNDTPTECPIITIVTAATGWNPTLTRNGAVSTTAALADLAI